ncbi:MAG: tyrosine-type recombinase/integrase [Fusobacterium sp.]|uniref:tyrosine-type recombinase/integrase n=1 Tax=Fusobacterium sp. TaxID=68766 RepID=UPI0026DD6ECF|nr:tyrosine-type recombinase/integrase [Fusobacterium sp.]MDO4689822.1 tyrosine-type recombinase/integrase [Fusobacterium sp.]
MKVNKKGQEVKYIRTEDLKKIREYLVWKNKIVFLEFINFGCNVALRISDLSKLCFQDIDEKNWRIELIEKKTKKKRIIKLNKVCQKAIKSLKKYYQDLGYDSKGYLFKSLSPYQKKYKLDMPFTINGVSKEFKKIEDYLNISYPLGSHSLRKTWGKNVYEKTLNIALIMQAFNHSSPQITLKYIGIEEEDINRLYEEFEI